MSPGSTEATEGEARGQEGLSPSESSAEKTPLFPRHLIIRLLVGFAVIFLVATLCGLLFKEPLERLGTSAVNNFGLMGLYASVLLIDTFPTPMSYAPLLLLAIKGGVAVWIVMLTGSAASICGGILGYTLGRVVGMPRVVEAWMEKNHPEQFDLLKRYGAFGVAAVAALPLPFALGTWTAGAMRVRFDYVLLACLVRIPKTGFYVALILGGLKLGGGQ